MVASLRQKKMREIEKGATLIFESVYHTMMYFSNRRLATTLGIRRLSWVCLCEKPRTRPNSALERFIAAEYSK